MLSAQLFAIVLYLSFYRKFNKAENNSAVYDDSDGLATVIPSARKRYCFWFVRLFVGNSRIPDPFLYCLTMMYLLSADSVPALFAIQ